MTLDVIYKLATVLIAFFNAFFAIKIFHLKSKKNDEEKEQDRKINLLKTLVLDHNLENYYDVFDNIENELMRLLVESEDESIKEIVDKELSKLFVDFRRRFYDSLLGIDEKLYDDIKCQSDELQSYLTETIFDNGVNLSYRPKFEELISEKLTITKTGVVKTLFDYRG